MNEQEYQYLNKLAGFSNLTGTEVIREIVFKNRLLQPKVPVLDQQSYLELRRIGNNVNQIAKQLNSGVSDVKPVQAITALSNQLEVILKKVINAS